MFTRLRRAVARWKAFASTRALDRDFQEELASHLQMLVDDNLRAGMAPAEARRAALVRLGNPPALRDAHADVRGLPLLDEVIRDARFALRLLAKEPWFATAAVVTLALGIGVNATGFSIVDAAFLRGLPFEDAARLHVLTWQPRAGGRLDVSYDEFQDWRARSRTFEGLGAYRSGTMSLSDDRARPEDVRGAWVTANGFELIRVRPILGRAFAARDDLGGAAPVALIGEGLWKRRYGGDPAVLGRTIAVNGRPATIVGVMSDAVRFPDGTDVWLPLGPTALQEWRDTRALTAFGLLRRGEDRRSGRAELNVIGREIFAANPSATDDLIGVNVETFTDAFVGGAARPIFLAVMGATCFVLLIACANVANLLLSRSVHRRREIALRMALGASRRRVVGQLLIESAVLGLFGGGLGLLLAIWGVHAFAAAVDDPAKPFWIVFTVDYAVFAYVAAACLAAAVVSGLAPALQASSTGDGDVLKEGARGATPAGRTRWLSGVMIVTELTLSVVLLVGAGLMLRSFLNVAGRDIGIRTDGLMTTDVRLSGTKYASADARRAFYDRLDSRLSAIPGLESATLTTGVPPFDGGERRIEIEGQRAGDPGPHVSTVTIGPRYFQALGVGLLRGRAFREAGSPLAAEAIVNDRLAERFFAGQDPIGRRIRLAPQAATETTPAWLTIVGVSPTIQQGSLQDVEPNPVVYLTYRREPPARMTVLVRSRIGPIAVLSAVQREVEAIDRDQPVSAIQTFEQMMRQRSWPYRVFGAAFGLFGIIALVLSAVGVYGVMAFSVAQRTQEIGVRMTLGATWRQIRWMVLRRGLIQVASGLGLGLIGAFALSRVLGRALVGVGATDPGTFVSIALLLTLVAGAACLVPARRAARVDPMVAIREG